jgi:hypothetical protein
MGLARHPVLAEERSPPRCEIDEELWSFSTFFTAH